MRQISFCLNPTLRALCERAIELESLEAIVQAYFIQTHLNVSFRVGSFQKGCLTLVVQEAAWASDLRYRLPALRDHLRHCGLHQLITIKIQVDASLATLTHKPKPNR